MSATTSLIPKLRFWQYLIGIPLLAVAGFVLALVLLVAVSMLNDYLLDRHYAQARAKLDLKISALGFPPSIANKSKDHAELSSNSPDGAWSMIAPWEPGRGYNWGIRNNKTGKVYFRVEHPHPNEGYPDGCAALWGPDGRYVAVTTVRGNDWDCVGVINLSRNEPTLTTLSEFSDAYPLKQVLLKPGDAALARNWLEERTDALEWKNPTDLILLCYLHMRLENLDSPERATAARVTLRFSGTTFAVLSKEEKFYEELPPPSVP